MKSDNVWMIAAEFDGVIKYTIGFDNTYLAFRNRAEARKMVAKIKEHLVICGMEMEIPSLKVVKMVQCG